MLKTISYKRSFKIYSWRIRESEKLKQTFIKLYISIPKFPDLKDKVENLQWCSWCSNTAKYMQQWRNASAAKNILKNGCRISG